MNEHVIVSKEIELTLRDGKKYKIAPLPLDDLIEVWPIIEKLEQSKEKVSIQIVEDIRRLAVVALKANNANVDEESVGKLVDLADMQRIIPVLVGQKTNVVSKGDNI